MVLERRNGPRLLYAIIDDANEFIHCSWSVSHRFIDTRLRVYLRSNSSAGFWVEPASLKYDRIAQWLEWALTYGYKQGLGLPRNADKEKNQ